MGKERLLQDKVAKIIHLRERGHSLPEIRKITGHGSSTIFKYIQDVEILPEFINMWRRKQGGSAQRAKEKWEDALKTAESTIGKMNSRDELFLLAGLYWGEGNKRELNLIIPFSINHSAPQ